MFIKLLLLLLLLLLVLLIRYRCSNAYYTTASSAAYKDAYNAATAANANMRYWDIYNVVSNIAY